MRRFMWVFSFLGMVLAGYGCSRQQAPATSSEPAVGQQPVGGAVPSGEKQPVAGRDTIALQTELKDKLGDKWTVSEPSPGSFVATRNQMTRPVPDLGKKVDDNIKSMRDEHKGVTAAYQGGDQVMLSGQVRDCRDAAKAADKFAGIDGINRIVINLTCTPK